MCTLAAGAACYDEDRVHVPRRVWIVLDADLLGHSAALPRRRRPPLDQLPPSAPRRADPRPPSHAPRRPAPPPPTLAPFRAGSGRQEAGAPAPRLPGPVAELLRARPGRRVAGDARQALQPDRGGGGGGGGGVVRL